MVPLTKQKLPDASSSASQQLASQLAPLPPELLDDILTHLLPFENPPLNPTRLLPPSKWRSMLFSGKILPWLWDLDDTALDSRSIENLPSYRDDDTWDWELLIRQLAQADVFSEGSQMSKVQLGLRNRRRLETDRYCRKV